MFNKFTRSTVNLHFCFHLHQTFIFVSFVGGSTLLILDILRQQKSRASIAKSIYIGWSSVLEATSKTMEHTVIIFPVSNNIAYC